MVAMSYIPFRSWADKIGDIVIYTVLTLFALCTLFPVYYIFVMSVTPYSEVLRNGGFVVFPTEFSLEAFGVILTNRVVPRALLVTIIITLGGTLLNLIATASLAYPLAKKKLVARKQILIAILFTMLFNGGMIPTYLVVKATGLLNTLWALIIPGLVSTFNLLVMKTFFQNLPAELEDAAMVDGCSEPQTLLRIVLPMSAPIMATMALFYGVNHWNTFMAGILYLTNKDLYPIQVVLRDMMQSTDVSENLGVAAEEVITLPPVTIKMSAVVIATLPMLIVYPFLQKYFAKGMLIGSIKG